MIDEIGYKKYFEGYRLTDCVVRKRDIFYFVLNVAEITDELGQTIAEGKTRIVACSLEKPAQKRWTYATYEGFWGMHAGASQTPLSQFVGVDKCGGVYAVGSGTKEIESDIAFEEYGPLRGHISKVKTIEGFTYICTDSGNFARRDNRNQWVALHDKVAARTSVVSHRRKFADFDAFNAMDFYFATWHGDVYHFNGAQWQRRSLPIRVPLKAICCGEDGYVYIGGVGGTIWKGRETSWELIHSDAKLCFEDMVWFQDRVYCTSAYGLWEITGNQVSPSDVPERIKICSGNLSAADGVMLLAGINGAAYHDGKSWNCLFNKSDF